MLVEQLSEKTREMVLAEIKAKISGTLSDIRTDRADPRVTTEVPRDYFIFDGAHTYTCPVVFLVVDSIDFPEEASGVNHINADVRMFCSVVVEDRDKTLLVLKTERYQSALFRILHRTTLYDAVKEVKIYSRVLRAEFSPIFTREPERTDGVFRKEVSLELLVRHFEGPEI